jgi:hypothetical protein
MTPKFGDIIMMWHVDKDGHALDYSVQHPTTAS